MGEDNLAGKEYGSLFENKAQWKEYLGNTVNKPSESFMGPTKELFWDNRLETIIINNKTGGPPTAFRPQQGKQYYLDRVVEQWQVINRFNW